MQKRKVGDPEAKQFNISNIVLLGGLEVLIYVFAYAVTRNPTIALIAFILCFVLYFSVYHYQYKIIPTDIENKDGYKVKTFSGADLIRIKIMDKPAFEKIIVKVFEGYGFKVNPLMGQFYVLIEAIWQMELTLITGIRRFEKVSDIDLQVFLKEMQSRNAKQGIVISTCGFSYKARIFAKQYDIRLMEIEELMSMIDHVQSVTEVRII